METFLIFRKLNPEEIDAIKHQLLQKPGKIHSLPGCIRAQDFPDVEIEFFSSSLSQAANQRLLKEVLNFGDKKIAGNPVSELLNLEGLPLWHYQRFRIYFRLQPVFLIREFLHNLTLKKDKTVCYSDFPKDNFSDISGNVQFIQATNKNKNKKNYRAVLNYGFFFLLRVIMGLLMPPAIKDKKHMIVDRSIRQYCRNLLTLEPKLDNYNLSHLFDVADERFMIVSEVEPPKLRGTTSFRLQKLLFATNGRRKHTIFGEYLLFRGLISRWVHRKKKKLLHDLSKTIGLINHSRLSPEESLIFKAFADLNPTNSFFILKHLAFRRFFNRHPFITISAIDENSPATRCILDAARLSGSKTIGIQHGNIGTAQPAYKYTDLDRKNRIMADLTLVWGDYWKEVLVAKGNFDPNSVKITGQIRTDIIPQLLAYAGLSKTKYSQNSKMVVFASQPIPDPSLRWQAAYDVFSSFAGIKDARLVVKLHPAEKNDVQYYTEIANQAGYKNPSFLYDVDLYELIAGCNLLITCYSTVGGEAIYFGKPLIILDHHRTDLLGYHADGVAWQATDAQSLSSLSIEILRGELIPDKGKYAAFIHKYAFSIDGKATQRCLSAITGELSDISH